MKKGFKHLIFILAGTAVISSFAGYTSSGGNNATTRSTQAAQPSIGNSLELLNTVWAGYGENDKFPAFGGDTADGNVKEGAPGIYNIDDSASLNQVLGFPADYADKIDNAASLIHMLNSNTFTCGAFHLKNPEDSAAVAAALKSNIMQRHWMCGFPDKLVVAATDDYIISFFGNDELIETFKSKLTTAYPSTKIISEDNID